MGTANGGGPVANTLQPFINGTSAGQQALTPYTQAGQSATAALLAGLGVGTANGQGSLNTPLTAAQFQASPGYQFQLQQGEEAILNNAAATGGSGINGNTLKALQTYGTGLANQDWNTAYSQNQGYQAQTISGLQNLAGTGASTGTTSAQIGAGAANNLAGNITSAQQTAASLGGAAANNLTSNLVGAQEQLATLANNAANTQTNAASSAAGTLANTGLSSGNNISSLIAQAIQSLYGANTSSNTQSANLSSNSAQLSSSTGQQIAQLLASLGTQTGSNLIGAGNATAAGTMGVGNALSGGLDSIINNLQPTVTNPSYTPSSQFQVPILGGGYTTPWAE